MTNPQGIYTMKTKSKIRVPILKNMHNMNYRENLFVL